jgi:hypothetical protein
MEVATAGELRRGEAVAGLLKAWLILNLVWAAAPDHERRALLI